MKGTFKFHCRILLIVLVLTAITAFGQQPTNSLPLIMTGSEVSSLRSLSDEDLTNFVNQLEADPTIPFGSLPRNGISGTYWSLQHPDWPPLPADTSQSSVWQLQDSFLLNDLGVDYDALVPAVVSPRLRFSMDSPLGGGSGSGGALTPNGSGPSIADFGTNLWIAQWSVVSNTATGIASNTLPGVQYEIQSVTDLLSTNWVSLGFIFGSEDTNWTPLNLPSVSMTNNMFFRIRSWISSDGSGLPDWWELRYFGHVGVDPNDDPAGDGWNNYQKFQNGWNPFTFYTPTAPRGLTVVYSNTTAIISWSPSGGPVTNYLLTLSIDGGLFTTNFNVPSTTTSVSLDVSDFESDVVGNDLPDIDTVANLTAEFPRGNSATANGGQPYVFAIGSGTISLVEDNQNNADFAFSALPPNTTALRLVRNDFYAESQYGDFSQNTNFDISIIGISNGLVQIPAAWLASPVDVYADSIYHWFVQPVNNTGATTGISYDLGYTENGGTLTPPFFNGQVQLKQNLIFQLRAGIDTQFLYNNQYGVPITNPPAYAYSGFYGISSSSGSDPVHGTYNVYSPNFDFTLPYANNYLYRNFVFEPSDVDSSGRITNGFYVDAGLNPPSLIATPRFQFNPPITSSTVPLLATNDTKWLVTDLLDAGGGADDLLGLTETPSGGNTIFTMGTLAQNWFGLRFISTAIAYGPNDAYQVNAGRSITVPVSGATEGFIYPEVVQPQFQTVEYDFWNPLQFPIYDSAGNPLTAEIPVPGMPGFAPTNTSQDFIIAVGTSIQVAAYAKLAVTNSLYTGVYGYLGQYFDQAYKFDTNGMATTNITGMLSPYGNFFATEPGNAALVTMPDVDSGARGTGVVHCISMNVDKNHDGKIDLTYEGPDTTSQWSPMEFWINNDYDVADNTYGHDATPNSYYNDGHLGEMYGISSPRDLEDYARLWICGMPALTNGNYTVTLGWQNVTSGNPTINLFNSVETNGGVGYLSNTNIAKAQVFGADIIGFPFGSQFPGKSIATITPAHPLVFPTGYFATTTNRYFLFDGADTNGTGELALTIYDANSNQVAQTGVWLDLHDVRDFYERLVITNNMTGVVSNWTCATKEVQSASANALGNDTNIIVYAHGGDNTDIEWLMRSDTIFKRLYWTGYRGKFSSVRWPSPKLFSSNFGADWFNNTEVIGLKSGLPFKNYLAGLKTQFPGDKLHVWAHSAGGPIASEAARLGAPIDTLILASIAMPASCYDVDAPTNEDLVAADVAEPTPEWQIMGYRGIYTNLTFRVVNYFNTSDSLLIDDWMNKNQLHLKPSRNSYSAYLYDGTNAYYTPLIGSRYQVTDSQESRAMVSRSRTWAIGAQGPAAGQTTQGIVGATVDLQAQLGLGSSDDEHGAFFTRPLQTIRPYYLQVEQSINP